MAKKRNFPIPGERLAVLFIVSAIIITYYFLNRQFIGPAYLSDEIGYLSKAITLAGYKVDGASSWHGGYSLFLWLPYRLFNNPYLVWQVILVINALMWGISYWLLYNLLKNILPQKRQVWLMMTVVACAVYPSWVIMSGYAFTTPAFVIIFMFALNLLIIKKGNRKNNETWRLIAYSILVGLLYWIHPTGLAVVVASILYFLVRPFDENKIRKTCIYIGLLISIPLIYKGIIHPAFNNLMTPQSQQALTHYEDVSTITSKATSVAYWKKFAAMYMGQLSYIVISTFGIIMVPVIELSSKYINSYKAKKYLRDLLKDPKVAALTISFLSLLGIIAIGSLAFAADTDQGARADLWIYGRYLEVVTLPLIGYGLIAKWRLKYTLPSLLILLIGGLILGTGTNANNTLFDNNNLINIASFWPLVFHSSTNYQAWFAIGAVGILLVWLLAIITKKRATFLIVIPIFIATISIQQEWHSNILSDYSKPSGIYEFVTTNFSKNDCIGFNYYSGDKAKRGAKNERLNLYFHYLYQYKMTRLNRDEWIERCDGPYLTYDLSEFNEDKSTTVIGRATGNGLYVVIKSEQLSKINGVSSEDFYFNDENENCVIKGCIQLLATDVSKYSQVGRFDENSVYTTGKEGYLIFGPYIYSAPGNYILKINGSYGRIGGSSRVEVANVTIDGKLQEFLSEPLRNEGYEYKFIVPHNVGKLEFRVYVDDATDIRIDSYGFNTQ